MRGLTKIIGQEDVVRRLRAFAELYARKGNPPDHILLVGQNGMGKRTIAEALADETKHSSKSSSSTTFERKGDLTAILTSLEEGDFLFLEDISNLRDPLT